MGRMTPTLGYPSRTAAALALKAQGRTDQQIADAMGKITAQGVSALISEAKRNGRTGLGQRGNREARLALEQQIFRGLTPHAHARGISVHALQCRLLQVIIADNMVNAILDDGHDADEGTA